MKKNFILPVLIFSVGLILFVLFASANNPEAPIVASPLLSEFFGWEVEELSSGHLKSLRELQSYLSNSPFESFREVAPLLDQALKGTVTTPNAYKGVPVVWATGNRSDLTGAMVQERSTDRTKVTRVGFYIPTGSFKGSQDFLAYAVAKELQQLLVIEATCTTLKAQVVGVPGMGLSMSSTCPQILAATNNVAWVGYLVDGGSYGKLLMAYKKLGIKNEAMDAYYAASLKDKTISPDGILVDLFTWSNGGFVQCTSQDYTVLGQYPAVWFNKNCPR